MTAAKSLELVDWQDYLHDEERAAHKHEYLSGYVYAMSGATLLHDVIANNTHFALRRRMTNAACRVFSSDVKVRIRKESGFRFYYPDVQVHCGPFDPLEVFIDNPVAVVEVASPSTRRIDEGEKREGYLAIPSLAAYLLIDSDKPSVTVWRRQGTAFQSEVYSELSATIPLPEIGVELPLAEIYAKVDWSAVGEEEQA